MIKYYPAGTAGRKSATSPVSLRTLLAGAMLLSAPLQVCLAVTVQGTAADGGVAQPATALPKSRDVDIRGAGAATPGMMAVSGALRERRISASLAGEQRSGTQQADTDARLFLFVLLGFAAIAAWLAEVLGRKE